MIRTTRFALLFSLVCVLTSFCQIASSAPQDTPPKPDLTLSGDVNGSQNHSYVEVPFNVPRGIERVTIVFDYTEKDQRTALDLGLLDPSQLRCWSGGNKSVLTVALSDATPSCLPGPIRPGIWRVLIGVPNIRSQVTSHYDVQVFFTRTGLVADEPAVLREPLRTGPAWYRGDLHMHTAHSDGQCASLTGKMVPCPVFVTVDAAARRGLDFIAISDHNATSQYDAMRELQPYFDKLLLIPGREITTFEGHLNFLGATDFLDFRVAPGHIADMNTLLRNARDLGALTSINHPRAPTGEICMGCGWTPDPPADVSLLNAVEVVNGGSEDPQFSGIPFWEHQLDLGFRLAAIAGSDSHRPMTPLDHFGSVGRPTTVVYASELSTPAILAGIRAGHVFIDLTGSADRVLELAATMGSLTAHMGDALWAPSGQQVTFDIKATGVTEGRIELLEDGKPVQSAGNSSADKSLKVAWTSDGKRHWFRVNILDADNKLWLLSNPIYMNWDQK